MSRFGGMDRPAASSRVFSSPHQLDSLGNIEHFEIFQRLGTGGMGVVFLARDSVTKLLVVVKLLRSELAEEPSIANRFLTEARRLKKLNHPNIVKVLEVAECALKPFFVMPYASGGSLARHIRTGAPLARQQVLRWSREVAAALQYTHRQGIIHRDIKPSNLLVDINGSVLLADFGLARAVFNASFAELRQAHCEGTAPYMSPAVAAGKPEDSRCDIYAFGALLYEMLTGRPPYQGPDFRSIIRKILAGPPVPLLKLNPKAPRNLVAIAQVAMARAHHDRYSDMGEVVADLERAAQGLPPRGPRRPRKSPARRAT